MDQRQALRPPDDQGDGTCCHLLCSAWRLEVVSEEAQQMPYQQRQAAEHAKVPQAQSAHQTCVS
ncbi:hypothetical protein [Streptomyces adustus]